MEPMNDTYAFSLTTHVFLGKRRKFIVRETIGRPGPNTGGSYSANSGKIHAMLLNVPDIAMIDVQLLLVGSISLPLTFVRNTKTPGYLLDADFRTIPRFKTGTEVILEATFTGEDPLGLAKSIHGPYFVSLAVQCHDCTWPKESGWKGKSPEDYDPLDKVFKQH
jgi:hypothetical protein